MPTASWRGTLSFGLVAIPVRMYRATESDGVSFRMLCATDGTPIQNKRWCPEEQKIIGWTEVTRGYEISRSEFIEITDADLERLPLPSTNTIDVLAVVPNDQINESLFLDQSYYLEPEPAGMRPYALLREALRQTNRSALGKLAMRQREHLCRVSGEESVLMLNTLHWAEEVRAADQLKLPGAEVEIRKRELDMALALLDNLSTDFKPEEYRDEYQDALQQLVEAKRAHRRLPKVEQPKPSGDNVVDLMAVLKAAVESTSKGGAQPRRPASRTGEAARRRRAS